MNFIIIFVHCTSFGTCQIKTEINWTQILIIIHHLHCRNGMESLFGLIAQLYIWSVGQAGVDQLVGPMACCSALDIVSVIVIRATTILAPKSSIDVACIIILLEWPARCSRPITRLSKQRTTGKCCGVQVATHATRGRTADDADKSCVCRCKSSVFAVRLCANALAYTYMTQ